MPAKRYRVRLTGEDRKELDRQVNTGRGSGPASQTGQCGRSSLRLCYLNQVAAGIVKDGYGDGGQFGRLHCKNYAQ